MTKYFILFCLAGIIEIIFLGLGMGTSVFSVLAALSLIYLSVRILGLQFVNGRIIRLAVAFSIMNIILGNIPVVVAEKADRLRPISTEFSGNLLSALSIIFKGPLDHYIIFWITQSVFFTAVFLGIFIIFSKLIRRFDNGISAGTVSNQDS